LSLVTEMPQDAFRGSASTPDVSQITRKAPIINWEQPRTSGARIILEP
jgi:hypothetical protein